MPGWSVAVGPLAERFFALSGTGAAGAGSCRMKCNEADDLALATEFIRACARGRAKTAADQILRQEAAETARLLVAFDILQRRLSRPMARPCVAPRQAVRRLPTSS
jgi:hypothetical protein